jgi:hypothetical protein
MYASELLRKRKQSAAQVVSPTPVNTGGLWTQIRRYKSSVYMPPVGKKTLNGQVNVTAQKAGCAVCANPVQQTVNIPGQCCDLATQYPRGFYGPRRPDCPPVNGPPVTGCVACPVFVVPEVVVPDEFNGPPDPSV